MHSRGCVVPASSTLQLLAQCVWGRGCCLVRAGSTCWGVLTSLPASPMRPLQFLLQIGRWYHSLLCRHREHSQATVHRAEDGRLFKKALPAAGTRDRSKHRYWKCKHWVVFGKRNQITDVEMQKWFTVLRIGGSRSKRVHLDWIRCKGMLRMWSEAWEEGYEMGKPKADSLQTLTIVMLSVTCSNIGEFSQGH